jgi:hypothetical protein
MASDTRPLEAFTFGLRSEELDSWD